MLLINAHADHGRPLEPADAAFLSGDAALAVERQIGLCPRHRPTPLLALDVLAASLGLGGIAVKDEGQRLGLGSFKALGGTFALIRLVLEAAGRALGREVAPEELQAPAVRSVAADQVFCCATDGNHGRSVAAGARLVGARAVVFVHEGVSAERADAIARLGATVVRVPGTYDDSVAEAARRSAAEGWCLVSDTSWPGYERIPGLIMQGYTLVVREALQALAMPPTHVFVQAGVGGLAAAVAGHLALVCGTARPTVVVVEPDRAACLLESARHGQPTPVAPGRPTVMAMLECYEPSLSAWRILSRSADAFMTCTDADAIAALRRLARPLGTDPAIVAGESGAAGLAGLLRAAGDPGIRAALGLDGASRVLLINTEGATDPGRYASLLEAAEGYAG
ncbi:MAG TPA: diaminopropionate ammonia-lyase [Azospirillaceae bacterium]|nr:diaminopropionate ammonia-lyase [Azospirillaceae bacterium]